MTAPAGTSRRKRRSRHLDDITPEKVTSSFLACPRCSFFLSGYKLVHTDFNPAVESSEDGWLNLTWDHETRRLVQKNYGYRIDKDTIHFEGICRDCQRVFTCRPADTEEDALLFHIEIVPS